MAGRKNTRRPNGAFCQTKRRHFPALSVQLGACERSQAATTSRHPHLDKDLMRRASEMIAGRIGAGDPEGQCWASLMRRRGRGDDGALRRARNSLGRRTFQNTFKRARKYGEKSAGRFRLSLIALCNPHVAPAHLYQRTRSSHVWTTNQPPKYTGKVQHLRFQYYPSDVQPFLCPILRLEATP
jgi:hypothetical protein